MDADLRHERLIEAAGIMDFKIPFTVEEIDKACRDTIAANNLTDCYVRPIAWRGSKPMEGVERVWSARLGIHNRLLFRLHDAELEVLDVVTREDLLKTLERWR